MADENTTPDDLISELEEAAREFDPVVAAAFAAETRDELAAYREQRFVSRNIRRPFERGEFEFRAPTFVVPEHYQERAELFVVFETFVRAFVDPALVTAQLPALLDELDPERPITRVAFRRFGANSGTRYVFPHSFPC